MKATYKYSILFLLWCVFYTPTINGQIHYGAIEYEITINLEKRFPTTSQVQGRGTGGRGGGRNMTSSNRYLVQTGTLYFNDTMSVFKITPPESMMDLNRTFLTNTLSDLNSETIKTHVNLFGEDFVIHDDLPKRVWKFTNRERLIAGKMAKQAITRINDSTTIYAWFDTEVFPSVGPESYRDLPGAILGLAYEDGSITYFAKKIDDSFPNLNDKFEDVRVRKIYNRNEFEKEFESKYDDQHRYYRLIKDLLHFY